MAHKFRIFFFTYFYWSTVFSYLFSHNVILILLYRTLILKGILLLQISLLLWFPLRHTCCIYQYPLLHSQQQYHQRERKKKKHSEMNTVYVHTSFVKLIPDLQMYMLCTLHDCLNVPVPYFFFKIVFQLKWDPLYKVTICHLAFCNFHAIQFNYIRTSVLHVLLFNKYVRVLKSQQ